MSNELLSPDQLAEIRALGQVRPGFPEMLLSLFESSAMEALEGCVGAWMCSDARQLESFAHRLKGTAASLGALDVRARAERLENDAGKDISIPRERLDSLALAIDATCQAYADWLQRV